MTTTNPPAILTTPAESAQCPSCWADYKHALDRREWDPTYPAEYPTCSRFSENEFAHCDRCGSTDLLDTRSVFEVLAEAIANLEAPLDYRSKPVYAALSDEAVAQTEASARMARYDVVANLRRLAEEASPGHCSDCTTQAVRASVALVRAGFARL